MSVSRIPILYRINFIIFLRCKVDILCPSRCPSHSAHDAGRPKQGQAERHKYYSLAKTAERRRTKLRSKGNRRNGNQKAKRSSYRGKDR